MKKVKPNDLIPGKVYRDQRYPYVGKFRFIRREQYLVMKPVNELAPCYSNVKPDGTLLFLINEDWDYYEEDNSRFRNTQYKPRFEPRV
jgi:hypothetical protein